MVVLKRKGSRAPKMPRKIQVKDLLVQGFIIDLKHVFQWHCIWFKVSEATRSEHVFSIHDRFRYLKEKTPSDLPVAHLIVVSCCIDIYRTMPAMKPKCLRPCFRGMGILNSDRDDAELMRPGETQCAWPGLFQGVSSFRCWLFLV